MKTRVLGFVALAAVAVMTAIALFVVPADLNQGDAQRIMYPHVASAWLAYLSFGVTALAGIGWLWKRDLRLDAVALAGAEIGVVFTAFAIWGGMMWGRPIWGVFWQWEDPRLTTTALLLALYVGYLLLRQLTDDPERRATRAAIVGIVAAIDIPIIHFSVEWWRGLHQTATIGSPDRVLNPAAPMQFVGTLLGMLAAFTLAWLYLMIRRYQLARIAAAREEARRLDRIMSARTAEAGAMTDVGFVIAAYVVIIGGLAAYTARALAAAPGGRRPRRRGAMTVSAPSEPMLPPRRRPWGILVLVGVVVAVVGYLAFSSVGNALVYYLTPTELLGAWRCGRGRDGTPRRPGRGGQRQRTGDGPALRAHRRRFVDPGALDGRPDALLPRGLAEPWSRVASVTDGVFEATQVIVKHDENYEAPAPGTQPSDRAFEPGDEE